MRFDRRISRRSFLAAAGATSAVLALTACGGSSSSVAASSASGTASSAAGTAQGGTLNIMLETEVQSLDPQVATDGTSFEVIADYTDGLMQMDADGAAVPAIAETYDISEDGKTYTFHLRDAKWSNGEAVTAADFVFGWQRAVDPATASEYSYMLSDIGQVVNAAEIIAGEKPVTDLGVTAVDDKTLEVQLNVPVSYFLSLMYFPTFYPVNEAFYNTCKDTFGTSPDTVLSNGAFKLTDYQPAATAFTLEKNPDYYDAGKIALDGLAYQVIKDSQQALMSYQTGTLDITLLNGEQVDQVKDDPEFTSVGAGYLWYISPNIGGVPELANENLRKAITFALDRDAITGDVLKDGSAPCYTVVPPQFATGPDGSDFIGQVWALETGSFQKIRTEPQNVSPVIFAGRPEQRAVGKAWGNQQTVAAGQKKRLSSDFIGNVPFQKKVQFIEVVGVKGYFSERSMGIAVIKQFKFLTVHILPGNKLHRDLLFHKASWF